MTYADKKTKKNGIILFNAFQNLQSSFVFYLYFSSIGIHIHIEIEEKQ
jgi:hypothetical protein